MIATMNNTPHKTSTAKNGTPKPPSDPVTHGEAKADGRDEGGRFASGNKCSAGNAFARRCAVLRRAFAEAATEENVRRLADKLLSQALEGDVAASKVFLSYCVGRPSPTPDPDRLDLEEIGLLLALPGKLQLAAQAMEGVDPQTAIDVLRRTLTQTDLREITQQARQEPAAMKSMMDRLRAAQAARD